MVKFFRASDEETYSLQIDDHFEVLTKKTQISPGINITDLEGKIGVKVDVFTGLTLFNLQKSQFKTNEKTSTNQLFGSSKFFLFIVFADYLSTEKKIYSFSQMPTFSVSLNFI